MKKNIFNIFTLLVMALTGLSLTACSEDDLDTNQYKDGVSLNVFGPSPVMRGGQLRFIGSNLDQVSQILIPGCDAITSFDVVKSGTPSEIKVTVPKDGPTVGKVVLVTKTDERITTQSDLTYTEPIEFTAFAPTTVMPGEELTITGDYLNLVHSVGFADNAVVSEKAFKEHSRYKIVVVVPETARTGKVSIYDADLADAEFNASNVTYNTIESESVLVIGTPIISKISSPRSSAELLGTVTAKQKEKITITGEYLNLIASIKFGDTDGELGVLSDWEDFAVSEDGKTLTFDLPALAPDGDINLVCKSGVDVPVGKLVTVAPTDLKVNPNPAKNLSELTITGKDLDVIISVTFPNSTPVDVTPSETELKVTVPETAQEGDIVLLMANGKTVTVSYTLVKPTVTAYSANPVSAGGALSITGANLDLVKTVTFNGSETPVEVTAENDGTVINLTVPMDAQSGAVTLNLKNGTDITAPEISIEEAVFCYATALPGDDAELKAGSTMTLTVKNIDKLIAVDMNGTSCQFITSGDQLIIGIPDNAKKTSKLTLISSNGSISYDIAVIPNTEQSIVAWSGMKEITWNDGGRVMIPASKFEDVPAGAILTFSYTQKDQTWAQAQINYGNWSGINFNGDGENCVKFNQTLVPTDVYGWFSDGVLNRETSVVLTQEILDNIQAKKGGCEDQADCGIIIQGSDLIFTKATISYTISLEENIAPCLVSQVDQSVAWTLPSKMTWDDTGRFRILRNVSPISEMTLTPGKSVMNFYVEGTGQIQVNNANWGSITTVAEWNDGSDRVMTLTLDQALVDCFTGATSDGWSNTALILQGDGMTVKKITILP